MMILDRDINPERQIYYLGSVILGIVNKKSEPPVGLQEAYTLFIEKTSSASEMFFLALDWLYLLGIIDLEEGGAIRCLSEV